MSCVKDTELRNQCKKVRLGIMCSHPARNGPVFTTVFGGAVKSAYPITAGHRDPRLLLRRPAARMATR